MLTMGVVPIVDKGMGLDRTLHRLPALLVEDLSEVTLELLRQAYVEAVYRADEFEFERHLVELLVQRHNQRVDDKEHSAYAGQFSVSQDLFVAILPLTHPWTDRRT